MHTHYAPAPTALPARPAPADPDPGVISAQVHADLMAFLAPFLSDLDQHLDARLVRTAASTVAACLRFRERHFGLVLSELGAYITSGAHAPAGTKRLSNLLRSSQWTATEVRDFLWSQAVTTAQELATAGATVVVVWDQSVAEKPESEHSEGLGVVCSSKAKRLARHRPTTPDPLRGRPVFVPGCAWANVLIVGAPAQGVPPAVAAMRWWTNRGEHATSARVVEQELLDEAVARLGPLGPAVWHVWDRGYAGAPWLSELLARQVRFVVRWPKRYQLLDATGQARPTWELARGKRSWVQQQWYDPRRRCWRKLGVLAVRVRHPEFPTVELWLVVGRRKGCKEPWYLLTNAPCATAALASQVVEVYARRWQVEASFRYGKSELAMESPRLHRWERRLKLLALVTLAYAFLLSLLKEVARPLREWLLDHGCHRTGRRQRETTAPLYRLRWALCRLWSECPPVAIPRWQDSG